MSGTSALHILAKEGDAKTLGQALKSADPKYATFFTRRWHQLGHQAATIRSNTRTNTRTNTGSKTRTSFCFACGCSVMDQDGMRPLHYAAWYGNSSCIPVRARQSILLSSNREGGGGRERPNTHTHADTHTPG